MSMTNIKRSVAVGALSLSLLVGGGSALANGGGNSGNPPGQGKAAANCERTIARQEAKGVSAGGGPKAGTPVPEAPTNCDHFFQAEGLIGKNKN